MKSRESRSLISPSYLEYNGSHLRRSGARHSQPYPDMTIPADMPLHALQSELRVMQELRSAPSPPDMPHSRTDWRLGDHIDRLQRQIDSFDADL